MKAALWRESEIVGFVVAGAVEPTPTARESLRNSLIHSHHSHIVTESCLAMGERGICGTRLAKISPWPARVCLVGCISTPIIPSAGVNRRMVQARVLAESGNRLSPQSSWSYF